MKMTSVLSLTEICCFTIVPTHKQEPMNNIVICTYTLQHCNLHIYFTTLYAKQQYTSAIFFVL
jgi:hypothetical protein